MDEGMLMGMRVLRTLSASVEIITAVLLWRMTDAGSMLRVNSLAGAIGPFVFISVSALGLAASAGDLPIRKLALVLAGVALVVIGTRA